MVTPKSDNCLSPIASVLIFTREYCWANESPQNRREIASSIFFIVLFKLRFSSLSVER